MRFSGKKILLILFGIAFALCFWIRSIASKPRPVTADDPTPIAEKRKPQLGYRNKMFPSMEQARAVAEKELNKNPSQKNIITKYESYDDGWLFYYESEKYLNSANPNDKASNSSPILVHKDSTIEYLSDFFKRPKGR